MWLVFVYWYFYPATLWNSFILTFSVVVSQELSTYMIMSSAKRSFYFLLSNLYTLCISFSCLVALATTCSSVLNKSGRSEHPCLVLGLRGKACSFTPLIIVLALPFHIWPLCVEESSFYIYLVERFFFYHEWMLNFVKRFSLYQLSSSCDFYPSFC